MYKKKIILICEDCLSRNYTFQKNRMSDKRMELNKYCPTCKHTTLHKESK